jgi:replicative DNA helicase
VSEHDEIAGRIPPHDIEAEKAVLSAILLDNDAIHAVVTEVRDEDFYHPSHQMLYRSMVRLRDDNQPVDLTTLAAYLKGESLLDSIGGPIALAEIADYEATPANIIHYAKIVRDRAIKRSLI